MVTKINLLTSSQVIKTAPKKPIIIVTWLKRQGIAASLVRRIGG